jgi:hypothetical protein
MIAAAPAGHRDQLRRVVEIRRRDGAENDDAAELIDEAVSFPLLRANEFVKCCARN